MNIVSVAKKLGYRGPTKRLDHSRMYICTMFGLFFLSLLLLIIGPISGSVLDKWTQIMLSVCTLVGSLICIVGIVLGTRVLKPKADIRICYQIGQWGIVSICASMFFYVIGVIDKVGHLFGLAILIGCAWVAIDFEYETERLDRKFKSEVKRISENEP